ncbi:hypothetical protein ES332_D12G088600v1 [Gossypium tomentosum]|uniref:Uncharacterized protein n=1 Tax=Gossypium tomentosum TaxID=34277 RepID=A0A5D2I6B0_GOSTO|nr:hypothetical protein ES332_D12G088600v1 [Gossypium tomentosum]
MAPMACKGVRRLAGTWRGSCECYYLRGEWLVRR